MCVCVTEHNNRRCGGWGHWSGVGGRGDVMCIDPRFAMLRHSPLLLLDIDPCAVLIAPVSMRRNTHTHTERRRPHIYIQCLLIHALKKYRARARRCEPHTLWMFRSSLVLLVQPSPWQPASPLRHCCGRLEESTHERIRECIHTYIFIDRPSSPAVSLLLSLHLSRLLPLRFFFA